MLICPLCDAEIPFIEDDLEEGDTFPCDECGGELRLVNLDPLEVESAEEDLDNDDDDGDDW
jgi:lysine biosynthesis protein LysW